MTTLNKIKDFLMELAIATILAAITAGIVCAMFYATGQDPFQSVCS